MCNCTRFLGTRGASTVAKAAIGHVTIAAEANDAPRSATCRGGEEPPGPPGALSFEHEFVDASSAGSWLESSTQSPRQSVQKLPLWHRASLLLQTAVQIRSFSDGLLMFSV